MINHHATLLAAILTITVILIQFVFIDRFPAVHVDEPWNANRAWHFIQTSDPTTTIDVGPFPDGKGLGTLPLALLIRTVPSRFLGLGLVQMRLASVFFGGLLLFGTFLVGRLMYQPSTGLLALIMVGLSQVFLQTSHRGRPDIIAAAFIVVAFACMWKGWRSDKWVWHLVAGAVVGLSGEVHLNGILLGVAIALCYPVFWGWGFWRRRGFWAFIIGAVSGAIVVFLIGLAVGARPEETGFATLLAGLRYLLPGIEAGTSLPIHGLAGTHRPPIMELSPTLLIQSFLAELHYRYAFRHHPLTMMLVGVSLLFLLARRDRPDRVLLVFLGVSFALFVLLVSNKASYYAILFYPFMLLAVAALFVALLTQSNRPGLRSLVAGVIILFLVFLAARQSWTLFRSRNYDYIAITEEIREVLGDDAKVMAMPTWWLGLSNYDFRSTFTLSDYHFMQGYTLTDGIEASEPDYIIVDEILRDRLLDDDGFVSTGLGSGFFKLPRKEFHSFLAQRGEKQLEIEDPWHGLIEVYQIKWD
ncbi:MAG: glycosyltransferase family 39 protein [Chloroflexota bacterium]|nr:glycosyltransferase family 39 protein [Chloroflexota bacterium]